MTPVAETNNSEEHVSESDIVKQLHGEIIYEPNGFISKIRRKDKMLNRHSLNTYNSMYKGDKEDFSNREETTKLRRENAQKMTNSFYDIVTDFYEYGKYLNFVCYML
jgi:sterol 24-C-methyltransferase